MALIECYECARQISDEAESCPHCGAPAATRQAPTPLARHDSTDARNVPPLYRFASVEQWLNAYVCSEIERLKREVPEVVSVPTGDALYLVGSLGFDSAIAPDGQVWINIYWDDEQFWKLDNTYEPKWRHASREERLCVLAHAQKRTRPELTILLPVRPASAAECTECNGTGYLHGGNYLWCLRCGTMGWLADRAS
jgi:hypothetical protein